MVIATLEVRVGIILRLSFSLSNYSFKVPVLDNENYLILSLLINFVNFYNR